MYYVEFVTLLALVMYLGLSFNVSKARKRYGVQAPAITGHPDFERYHRAHMNTLEHLVVFIPSMWIFGHSWNAGKSAAIIGIIWIIGRIIYALGYYKDRKKRGPGFLISSICTMILLIGGIVGIAMKIINA